MSEDNTNQDTTGVELAEVDVTLEEASPGETEINVQSQPVKFVRLPDAKSMRSYIFQKPDLREEVVDVPEWDLQILVRGLNAKTRSKILKNAMLKDGTPDLEKLYPDMVIATARHPDTKELIFVPADRDALNDKAGGVLERLAMAAVKLSGLDQPGQEAIADTFRNEP